jgi:hypothetical protein
MNLRNVEKLAEALRGCRGYVKSGNGPERIEGALEEIAIDLARQAVLAPSALTAEELGTLSMRAPPPINPYQDDRKLLLQGLVRAAKGELI